jgi:hypothetical protein
MAWILVNQIIDASGGQKMVENVINTDAIVRIMRRDNGSSIRFTDQIDINVSDSFDQLICILKMSKEN